VLLWTGWRALGTATLLFTAGSKLDVIEKPLEAIRQDNRVRAVSWTMVVAGFILVIGDLVWLLIWRLQKTWHYRLPLDYWWWWPYWLPIVVCFFNGLLLRRFGVELYRQFHRKESIVLKQST